MTFSLSVMLIESSPNGCSLFNMESTAFFEKGIENTNLGTPLT